MKLDRIQVKGFKSIRELDLELGSLNVLIGSNGAGKSNFISLFKLLNELVEERFQEHVARSGGAETFLYFGQKETEQIELKLHFGLNGFKTTLKPTKDDSLIIEKEIIAYKYPTPTDPYTMLIGSGIKESNLEKSAKAKPGKVADYVFNALTNWKVYHFHDTSESAKMKKNGAVNDNEYLRPDAGNLAAFLFSLKTDHQEYYELIRDAIRRVAPFFDDFLFRPKKTKNGEMIQLEWREKGSDYPFLAHHLSDGTLRFICLATLLLQPKKPSTILIDEPELGLHPYAISVLTSLFKKTSQSSQIIASTQSVPLVNQMQPENIIVVERTGRETIFNKLSKTQIQDWIDEYGLGDLWEKNVIGGRP